MKNFNKTVHDFGTVTKGTKLEASFIYNGNEPLTINDIQTTCGCTSKKYNSDTKTIYLTLSSDNIGQRMTNIIVKGEVLTLKANII